MDARPSLPLAPLLSHPFRQARCHEVLDAALAAGVTYFDCARSYGLSERFLGNWLRGRRAPRPADAVVGSKWGYT